MIPVYEYNLASKRIIRVAEASSSILGCIKVIKLDDLWRVSKKNKACKSSWVNRNMFVKGVEGCDFFINKASDGDELCKKGVTRKIYYCTLSFSKGLCVLFNSIPSRNLRIYLDKNYINDSI